MLKSRSRLLWPLFSFSYHYHIIPGSTCPSEQGSASCFPEVIIDYHYSARHDSFYFILLLGFALDGFPIVAVVDYSNERTIYRRAGGMRRNAGTAILIKPYVLNRAVACLCQKWGQVQVDPFVRNCVNAKCEGPNFLDLFPKKDGILPRPTKALPWLWPCLTILLLYV